MKDKIIFLIIGILIGAIITTLGFYVYIKSVSDNTGGQMEMTQMDENSTPPEQSDGNMEEPPEMQNGDDGEEPPEKPDGDDGEMSDDENNQV